MPQDLNVFALAANGIIAALVILAAVVIGMVLNRRIGNMHRQGRIPVTLMLPLRFVLRYGLLIITLLAVLSVFNVNIGSLWNFISAIVGLIAIGFVAVWSMLSNVSAAFLLLMFKPFKTGDHIEVLGDAIKGRVADMNFFFTTIRDDEDRIYNVPNNMFFQKATRIAGTPAAQDAPVNNIDHSQANLEGINLPHSGRSR